MSCVASTGNLLNNFFLSLLSTFKKASSTSCSIQALPNGGVTELSMAMNTDIGERMLNLIAVCLYSARVFKHFNPLYSFGSYLIFQLRSSMKASSFSCNVFNRNCCESYILGVIASYLILENRYPWGTTVFFISRDSHYKYT